MMHYLINHWSIFLLLLALLCAGMLSLLRVNIKKYLKNRPKLPPHRDNNALWDEEEDWSVKPKKTSKTTTGKKKNNES